MGKFSSPVEQGLLAIALLMEQVSWAASAPDTGSDVPLIRTITNREALGGSRWR